MTSIVRACAVLAAAAVAGCVRVPPRAIIGQRLDYQQALADSWKRQTLMNVVRMRYADAPVFLEVNTIIDTSEISGTASAGAAFSTKGGGATFPLGAEATFSNTPTVTYQPLNGERFMKSMLQPIPPVAVFQLLQSGWPAEVLLRVTLRSVNELTNQSVGRPADARFDQLVAAVGALQRSGGLHIRVEERQGGEGIVVTLPRGATEPAPGSADLRTLLGLDPTVAEYSLAFGLAPRSPREVAVLTRSMLEIMAEYSLGTDVPPQDVSEGRVLPIAPVGGPAAQLVHIQSGPSAPADAYAAIPYRGRWYWIDDRDGRSKFRFTFLMILSSLAETGAAPNMPLITVPSR